MFYAARLTSSLSKRQHLLAGRIIIESFQAQHPSRANQPTAFTTHSYSIQALINSVRTRLTFYREVPWNWFLECPIFLSRLSSDFQPELFKKKRRCSSFFLQGILDLEYEYVPSATHTGVKRGPRTCSPPA